MIETGQFASGIGSTPWKTPDMYIKFSPIFNADKILTPLLLVHNSSDGIVPFYQSLSLFNSLRRLKKKVWLLQYDGEEHVISDNNKLDYTIRQQQFFGCYLKDYSPPSWMLHGVPFSRLNRIWALKVYNLGIRFPNCKFGHDYQNCY
jgi:hypothetical protein